MADVTPEPTPIFDQLVKEYAAKEAYEQFFGPEEEEEV